ncbi:unnamed protein product, partial [Didymodactylos carnosus]
YVNLTQHLRTGKHRRRIERSSMRDMDLKAIREKQTKTVVVDEVEEEDDDEFDDNQAVEETEQRNNLRNSMGISNEQSSPPASFRNRAVSPDKRAGSTTDVRPDKKRSSSRKRTGVK